MGNLCQYVGKIICSLHYIAPKWLITTLGLINHTPVCGQNLCEPGLSIPPSFLLPETSGKPLANAYPPKECQTSDKKARYPNVLQTTEIKKDQNNPKLAAFPTKPDE